MFLLLFLLFLRTLLFLRSCARLLDGGEYESNRGGVASKAQNMRGGELTICCLPRVWLFISGRAMRAITL